MKKKIFLVLALAFALCCIFVISASAQVTTYDDAPVRVNYQALNEDIVVFDDGFSCPTSYVFKDISAAPNGKWGGPSIGSCFDFGYINEKTGKAYEFANIVELDLPQGLASIGNYFAHKVQNLKKVSIPDSVTTLGGCVFQEAYNLEKCIFEHNENSQLATLPTYAFYNTAIKAISLPDCITKIAGECCFSSCDELTAIYLSKKLTTIEGGSQTKATFDGDRKMYFVNEPFTYDNIPEKPTVYYFPPNFTSISNQCIFRYCESVNDVIVFGTSLTNIPSEWTFQSAPGNTVVFLGDMENVNSKNWGTKTLIFANEADKSPADIATFVSSQTNIFCFGEGNTTHLAEKTVNVSASCEVDAGVATYCYCGYEISKDAIAGTALTHDYDYLTNSEAKLVSIIYSSYSQNGVKTVTCANCKKDGREAVAPLFNSIGYSAPENGKGGIALGYLVNNAAIDEYASYTGKSVKYGVFAVLKDKLGENDVFAQDGTVVSGAITAEISTTENTAFEIKITGFTDDQKNIKIAMGAYVMLTDGTTAEYSYMQAHAPNEGEKYNFVSFNDIIKLLN